MARSARSALFQYTTGKIICWSFPLFFCLILLTREKGALHFFVFLAELCTKSKHHNDSDSMCVIIVNGLNVWAISSLDHHTSWFEPYSWPQIHITLIAFYSTFVSSSSSNDVNDTAWLSLSQLVSAHYRENHMLIFPSFILLF